MEDKSYSTAFSFSFVLQVFDLVTGQILLSVIFDVRVLCVAVDPVESAMFVGGQDGSVFVVNLRSPVRGTSSLE